MNIKFEKDELPIAALSVAEFKELLSEMVPKVEQVEKECFSEVEYVFGLKGIEQLLGVSHSTAQKLKDGILKPAVMQVGRKIIINKAEALKLIKRNGSSHRKSTIIG